MLPTTQKSMASRPWCRLNNRIGPRCAPKCPSFEPSLRRFEHLFSTTLGSHRCNRVKSKNGRCRFARPAAAVAARLRSTASAPSRCCPTHPSWRPPGISSLPVCRLRIFGPGVVLSNLHLRHIIFDCYDRSASPGAGYGLLCSCAQRLFLPPRSSRANRSCRPP